MAATFSLQSAEHAWRNLSHWLWGGQTWSAIGHVRTEFDQHRPNAAEIVPLRPTPNSIESGRNQLNWGRFQRLAGRFRPNLESVPSSSRCWPNSGDLVQIRHEFGPCFACSAKFLRFRTSLGEAGLEPPNLVQTRPVSARVGQNWGRVCKRLLRLEELSPKVNLNSPISARFGPCSIPDVGRNRPDLGRS